MIICDFHNHTAFSTDSEAAPEDMIEKAIALGLSYLCTTDHMDLDFPVPELPFTFSVPDYFRKMVPLREQYKDRITLLTGIELGLQPGLKNRLSRLLADWDFDFVIGSSHLADGKDPYDSSFWEGRTETAAIRRYFETILENLDAFDDIDVYGHLDYVVRYAPSKAENYSYQNYREIIDEILRTLVSKNIGLELNTSGFKYGLGAPNPHTDILKRYRELGGEIITVGSDAHRPEHLAYDFQKVPEILENCGFSYYTIFKKRKPEFIKI